MTHGGGEVGEGRAHFSKQVTYRQSPEGEQQQLEKRTQFQLEHRERVENKFMVWSKELFSPATAEYWGHYLHSFSRYFLQAEKYQQMYKRSTVLGSGCAQKEKEEMGPQDSISKMFSVDFENLKLKTHKHSCKDESILLLFIRIAPPHSGTTSS